MSGFKYGNQIITDDKVYNVKDAVRMEIRFFQDDGDTESKSVSMDYSGFLKLLPEKSEFDHLGIAVIPADFDQFRQIPSLCLCKSCDVQIGFPVAIIGYQSEYKNLALKTGIISSFYKNSKGLSFIQFDGTVKPGNSGAPLLHLDTGHVIGVLLHREFNNSKSFKEIMEIIDGNLKVLKELEGKSNFFDVDLAQVLYASQSQIKYMAKEFSQNAIIRAGIALEIGHVSEYMETKMELDADTSSSCD